MRGRMLSMKESRKRCCKRANRLQENAPQAPPVSLKTGTYRLEQPVWLSWSRAEVIDFSGLFSLPISIPYSRLVFAKPAGEQVAESCQLMETLPAPLRMNPVSSV